MLAKLNGTKKELQDVKQHIQQIHQRYKIVEEDQTETLEAAWDDVTGVEFDPQIVNSAREDEVKYIREMKLHKKVDIGECWGNIGTAPIKAR